MLVVLVVHMRDATPHVMYDFSHSVSGDTEVGETIVCKSKLCKTATQGREHQMRLQVYAKVHHTKLETSKEVENRWNCDVSIYAVCASLCLCVHCAHICNVHCPLRTDSAYRGRFAGNIIRVESMAPLLAFQKCL